jgi:hypothetical protein
MRMPPHICGVILATSLTVALAMPAYVATAQRKGMALVPNHHRCVEVLQLEKVEMDAQSGEVKVVLGRLGPASGTEDRVCRFASAAARLLRAYTMQLKAIAGYGTAGTNTSTSARERRP